MLQLQWNFPIQDTTRDEHTCLTEKSVFRVPPNSCACTHNVPMTLYVATYDTLRQIVRHIAEAFPILWHHCRNPHFVTAQFVHAGGD